MYKHSCSYCWLVIVITTGLFTACATNSVKVDTAEEIEKESAQLQESNLLDAGILLFDTGKLTEHQQQKEGVHEDIRNAEARFMAYHLKQTMQRTNVWGAIRVLPTTSQIVDVLIEGTIIASNGEVLTLLIHVSDSTGQDWFEKTYKAEAGGESYQDTLRGKDVYQHVYNRIAKDISRYRKTFSEKDLITIRNTSELRYAAGISSDPFSDYITFDKNERFAITRLPAKDDPMLERVRRVRAREFLFIDTIDEHYANFYAEMWSPYKNWRKYYLIEAEQRRAVNRRATQSKFVGALIMIAGLYADQSNLFTGGALVFKSGMDISKEAEIHNEAIRELGDSLRTEVSPLVVEIQGRTIELTGSIEEQYQKWRELLREIYRAETGFAFEESAVDNTQL